MEAGTVEALVERAMQREPRFGIVYDERMPVFEAATWGYRPSRTTVGVGLAGVGLLLLCIGLFAAGDLLVARAPRLSGDGGGRREANLPTPAPPDRNRVIAAYDRVRSVREQSGVEGLAKAGAACFAELDRTPNYRQLDFCLAFDAFAAGVNQALGTPSGEAASYFSDSTVRHIRAFDRVGASRGEADARIVVINRLASGVARERMATEPLYPPPPPPPEEDETLPESQTPPSAAEEPPYVILGPGAVGPAPIAPSETPPPPDGEAAQQPAPTPPPTPPTRTP